MLLYEAVLWRFVGCHVVVGSLCEDGEREEWLCHCVVMVGINGTKAAHGGEEGLS
jgi:hypothetical protein